MKTVLFFILMSTFVMAQNPDLMNTDWQITKVIDKFRQNKLPPPMPYQQVTRFYEEEPQLILSFFNTLKAKLIFNGQNNFTLSWSMSTTANYPDDNGEVNEFFKLVRDALRFPRFTYFIQNSGNQKSLIIKSPETEEIHFIQSELATINTDLSNFIIAPNPVKNILTVQNSAAINSAEIFDFSGKKIYETKNEGTKSLKIDMRNFKTGTYFIKLNNAKTFKIIKE